MSGIAVPSTPPAATAPATLIPNQPALAMAMVAVAMLGQQLHRDLGTDQDLAYDHIESLTFDMHSLEVSRSI